MVIFYVSLNLDYHTFSITTSNVALLHWHVYSQHRYQGTCDVIAPNASSQEVGHWRPITLHPARVLFDPSLDVPLKIDMPPMPQATIIEYAQECIDIGVCTPTLVWVILKRKKTN